MALIDVSHEIRDGQQVYPHLPPARIRDELSREQSAAFYADGTTFQIGRVDMIGNLGTWVDAPYHRWADGADLAALPLDRLVDLPVTAIAVDPERTALDVDLLAGHEVAGRAVLFHTDWSRRWQSPGYGDGHPHLTAAVAERLVAERAAFVGIDALNVDDPDDGRRPVHSILLRAGIPIAENLTNLAALPAEGARLHAAPIKLGAMGSFPVRAYAVVP